MNKELVTNKKIHLRKQNKKKKIKLYISTGAQSIYKNLHKRKKLKNPLLIASTTEGMYSTSHRIEKKQNH